MLNEHQERKEPFAYEEDDMEASSVLLVEDDLDLLSFITSGLIANYQVIKAADGQDGLAAALEHCPDLVVTDLMMPGMDGLSLCRELKTNPATSHIPVIMLTAKKTVESQLEGLETGADDYITKPFSMVLLEARINNLLKTRRLLREKLAKTLYASDPSLAEYPMERKFLEKAVKVVEEHYSDPAFKTEELAAALNIGLRSLQRKLKSVADQTPAKLINGIRMRHAARLLVGTALSVTEIAFEVGCEDSSNFTKIFKQEYGLTPSRYRSSHRND